MKINNSYAHSVVNTLSKYEVDCTLPRTISAPDQPSVSVNTTATGISLSWSVPSSSVVDSYEVVWERNASKECPDVDEGSTTITNGSTNHLLMKLQEGSTYIITVTAANIFGTFNNSVYGVTEEAGEWRI